MMHLISCNDISPFCALNIFIMCDLHSADGVVCAIVQKESLLIQQISTGTDELILSATCW